MQNQMDLSASDSSKNVQWSFCSTIKLHGLVWLPELF